MTASPYISPRIGRRTAVVVWLFCMAIWLALNVSEFRSGGGGVPVEFSTAVGLIYGLAASSCFVATALPRGGYRLAARVLIVFAGVAALTVAQWWFLRLPSDPGRYLLFLGGVVVVQSALPHWMRLPQWRTGPVTDRSALPQYQIGDLLVATAGLAILFGVGARFPPPVDERAFWVVTIACWILLPLLSSLTMAAVLHRRRWISWQYAATCLLIGGSMTMGLAQVEKAVRGGAGLPTSSLWLVYGSLLAAHGFVVAAIGLAGRKDAQAVAARCEQPSQPLS